ncbi:unnamed protein product [Boreogadus saida]
MAKILCVIVAALASFMLADSLVCNRCTVGVVGICLNTETVTCTTNTSVCFTGKATFPSISFFSGFTSQGCQEPGGCNGTSSTTLLGAKVTTTVECCDKDNCNPFTISSGVVSSARLSLVAVFASALMVSGWSTL